MFQLADSLHYLTANFASTNSISSLRQWFQANETKAWYSLMIWCTLKESDYLSFCVSPYMIV